MNYSKQSIDEDDVTAVIEVLHSDYLTQGPTVKKFEDAIAERVGAKHAVAVSNGTAGLHLACLAAGVSPEGRGITSTLSFVASANCLLYAGMEAHLTDIDPKTLGIATTKLEQVLTKKNIDIVIPVHFAGLASNSREIKEMSQSSCIIEDACHALGGTYDDGSPVGCGKYSDMSVFSFHAIKPITTGEGGLVVTNNDNYAHRLRLLRNHGIERDPGYFEANSDQRGNFPPWFYEQQSLGFNYRLSDIQAALGLSQLNKLEKFCCRRREIALHYDEAFSSLPFRIFHSSPAQRNRSGLHLYLIHIDWENLEINRADFMQNLSKNNINTQVHYIPIHLQPYYARSHKYEPGVFSAAEHYYNGCLSLPLFAAMTDEDVERVVINIKKAFEI